MTSEQKTIFISYRRSTDKYFARSLFKFLRDEGYDVFLDVESLPAGDFERIILGQIASRAHFIVILSIAGVERCTNEDDWLRKEIEYAIDTNRNIIPIMLDEFKFENATQYLTGKLTLLSAKYNGLRIIYEYIEEGMIRLSHKFLKIPVYVELQSVSLRDRKVAEQEIAKADAAPPVTEKELAAEEYIKRGYEKNEKGDYIGAIADLNHAIRLNPTDATAYNNRGVSYKNKGEYDHAIADYNEAIRLKPDYASAYYNRANSYYIKRDYDRAITNYNQAILLHSDFIDAYMSRGNAYSAIEAYDLAIDDYNEAIRLKSDNAIAYHNRAIAYEKKRAYAYAIADYSEAMRLNPHSANHYWGLGTCYYALGKYPDALKYYQLYLQFVGKNPHSFVVERVAELKQNLGVK